MNILATDITNRTLNTMRSWHGVYEQVGSQTYIAMSKFIPPDLLV